MVGRYHACSSAARRCDAPAKHRPWPGILFTWVLATFRATERSLGVNFKKWPKIGLQRVQNFDLFSSPGKVCLTGTEACCSWMRTCECRGMQPVADTYALHLSHYMCTKCALQAHYIFLSLHCIYVICALHCHCVRNAVGFSFPSHYLRVQFHLHSQSHSSLHCVSVCSVPCICIYLSFLMCILFTCTLRLHFEYIWNTSALRFLLHDVYTISAKQLQLHYMCSHTFTSTIAQLASFAISIGLVRIAVCALHFHSALRCMAHIHVRNMYIHVQSRTHTHTCTCTHTHTHIHT